MSDKNYYALIMAGGGGTRLWPMSRKATPKQLLPLTESRTMFRVSVERLLPIFPAERIYVVTPPQYRGPMRAEMPKIPAENFISEPYGRGNAPAAALAIGAIHQRDPQATVVLLPADHHIEKEDEFRAILEAAYEMAQDDYIVTLGITPDYPATGYGYIRQGNALKDIDNHTFYESLGFTEKPNEVTATAFIESGNYTWNAGIFVWRVQVAMREFERQQPKLYGLLSEVLITLDTPAFENKLLAIWDDMPETSIDFAVMEGAQKMVVVPVEIGWNDIGVWSSLMDVLQRDRNGNCFRGAREHVTLHTKNTLVYSDGGERMLVTIGVDNLIVVDTGDVLLICHKDRTQDVKEVVTHLRSTGKTEYL